MEVSASLEIASNYLEIRRAAAWLRGQVSPALTLERVDDLELAAVEVLTNIVRHAYGEADGNPIEIRLHRTATRLDFYARDQGRAPPADLLTREPPPEPDDPMEMAESGRGTALIRALVDEANLERSATETVLRLTMFLV